MLSNKNTRLVLRGDRCVCPSCGEQFNSTSAFDRHRTGLGLQRHCNPPESRGMTLNKTGFWISGAKPKAGVP